MGLRLNTPLCPAGHLPLKGGEQVVARVSLVTEVEESRASSLPPNSPLEGEMPGRAEGGAAPTFSEEHLQ